MPKKKTKAIAVKREFNPETLAMLRRAAIHLTIAITLLGAAGAGLYFAKRHVDRRLSFHNRAPKVVLKDRPAWMSDFLAEQIIAAAEPVGASSTFNRQTLVDVGDALRANPWIRKVKSVRRAYSNKPGDTIEIDCDYRVPLALVHWKEYFWLVDSEGVKLPEQFTAKQLPQVIYGRDNRLLFRIIEGVRQPPVESGRQWMGEDLMAGLTLAQYLAGQPFAEEIVRIDVANFGGRDNPKEAQLVLLTKRGTEVRWGRPINAKDFFIEVSVAQKLDYMRRVYEQFGRVDANQAWIDIRFDKITYPSSGEPHARIDSIR
jgi:hypothetical protein